VTAVRTSVGLITKILPTIWESQARPLRSVHEIIFVTITNRSAPAICRNDHQFDFYILYPSHRPSTHTSNIPLSDPGEPEDPQGRERCTNTDSDRKTHTHSCYTPNLFNYPNRPLCNHLSHRPPMQTQVQSKSSSNHSSCIL